MRNLEKYAVAVRRPDGEIEIKSGEYKGIIPWKPLYKIPFLRGIFSFIDSMVLGMKTLNYSVDVYTDEEGDGQAKKDSNSETKTQAMDGTAGHGESDSNDKARVKLVSADNASAGQNESKTDNKVAQDTAKMAEESGAKEGGGGFLTAIVMIVAIFFAIGLFMVLPYYMSLLFKRWVENPHLLALIEGVLRLFIFILYVLLISRMEDIKRVFRYHGAEHKCINCLETGHALTVDNVRASSKEHRRCGTSFLLYVMVVSIIFFSIIQVEDRILRVVLRIALIPLIAGVSYELIRLAGKSNNPLVRALSAPGLWMQRLTTAEPDDSMIEIGISSVEAVFDWKKYLKDNFNVDSEDGTEALASMDKEPVREAG
ncbi:MAG: DUF1385 domain-containing protein [Lachnospiraceae bacterium]|nr:DUF1385 domain-containing protein [Lachnospiraceae bacterium]